MNIKAINGLAHGEICSICSFPWHEDCRSIADKMDRLGGCMCEQGDHECLWGVTHGEIL